MTTEKNAPRIGKTSSHAFLGRVSPVKSINPQWVSWMTILSRKPGVGGNLSRLTAKEREGIERISRRRKSRGLQAKRLETVEVQACIGSEVVPGYTPRIKLFKTSLPRIPKNAGITWAEAREPVGGEGYNERKADREQKIKSRKARISKIHLTQLEEKQMHRYEFHEIAALFPMMDDKKLAELAESIASQGLLMPVVLFGGKILDGRNRYLACQRAGVEPRFVNFEGDNPWEYVWSTNAERRHLTDGQKYLMWLRKNELSAEWEAARQSIQEEANLKRSEATKEQPRSKDGTRLASGGATIGGTTCKEHKTSKLKVEASKTNRGAVEKGDYLYKRRPDLAERVISGEVSMEAALREVKNEEVVRQLEDIKGREVREATGLYDAIVIDPPWPMTKIDRNVRPNQTAFDYPTMSETELKSLKIPAADNCHAWLWATQRFLKTAFHLLEAWGLKYVCTFVWHKPGGFQPYGLPQYNCEFALYARKGSPRFIDITEFFTCFSAPRGRHSEKPPEFYETVRRVTGGRRLDMFSRRNIEGFDAWGNES